MKMLRNNFKKRILTLLIAIILGIAAYSQTVADYSRVLQANGYTLCNPQMDNNSIALEKVTSPTSYIVLINKDGDKIASVTIIAVLSQIGKYPFNDLEPVKLYPQYFKTPQLVRDLFLSVEPFIPYIEIKGNTVVVAAIYKPLAPIAKD